jgi:hypothetical protein
MSDTTTVLKRWELRSSVELRRLPPPLSRHGVAASVVAAQPALGCVALAARHPRRHTAGCVPVGQGSDRRGAAMIRAVAVGLELDGPSVRVLAMLLARANPRTAAERNFVTEVLDRIPLDLHPEERKQP